MGAATIVATALSATRLVTSAHRASAATAPRAGEVAAARRAVRLVARTPVMIEGADVVARSRTVACGAGGDAFEHTSDCCAACLSLGVRKGVLNIRGPTLQCRYTGETTVPI